ncbi:hypothetical protein ACSFC1_06825 [Pseudothermotoga sp. U03pept]|uniref:hypothetical protein n=1 Tax=Pseudothermotoga sp. U03pept TaxID=3447012 RepID=UPI003F054C22
MGLTRFLLSLLLPNFQLQKSLRNLVQPGAVKRAKGVVKAAVIQMEYSPVSNVSGFIALINRFLIKMTDFGPDIVVFPHLMDSFLFRVFPLFLLIGTRHHAKAIRETSRTTSEICERTMAEFSKIWNCTVVFGTTQGHKVYHVGNRQSHILETKEYKMAVVSHRTLNNSIQLDRLVSSGVRIIATPGFGVADYSDWDERYHMWAHSQMVGFYGLWSAVSGRFLGKDLKARACVTAPIPITNSLDGYIVKNSSTTGDTVLLAELDMNKIESFVQSRKFPTLHYSKD